MPTGYTSLIESGKVKTGREFIKLCARNFGAYIEERDIPLSDPVPDKFSPNQYYEERLNESINRLKQLRNMTIEEASIECQREYTKKIEETKDIIEKIKNENQKYKKILEEVYSWNPPTEGHKNLKEFAINQIKISMEPVPQYYYDALNSEMQSPKQWLEDNINFAEDEVSHNARAYTEEKNRVRERNKWIQELHDSLSE